MKKTVIPKIDIVLVDGVFLPRGSRAEIEISEQDFDFLSPYMVEIDSENEKFETPVKTPSKRGRKPKMAEENGVK